MHCLRLTSIAPGMVLARPARALDGSPLLKAGFVLTGSALAGLSAQGLEELWVVQAGESVPDPTVPEYLDRYGPDFAARLQEVFQQAMVNRTMQNLFLTALAHASECYRRYRLADQDGT